MGLVALIFTLLISGISLKTSFVHANAQESSGCADGSAEGFTRNPFVVACGGIWEGHIANSTQLCSHGWHTCSHRDKDRLKAISWREAVSLQGCFAFNAAQDSGGCQECKSNLEMDDLAGVGHSCPHQNHGQSSCITGGRIDVSCCVDTRLGTACSYRPGLATGILCCKDQTIPPRLTLTPPLTVEVTKGSNMSLTCSATGIPSPVVLWYRDGGALVNGSKRILTSNSGTLVVMDVHLTDSGKYRCIAWNLHGNVTTTTKVTVIEPSRGCADGSNEGLLFTANVSTCKGSWVGHVRRAKSLCTHGWRVCSAHDSSIVRTISWQQALALDGCYAYNSASIQGKCARCHNKNMAGIGRHCSHYQYDGASCMQRGRIDVYTKGDAKSGCFYQKNVTSGVLCCRIQRHLHRQRKMRLRPSSCQPACRNNGQCIGRNKCRCPFGYKGAQCQTATCTPPCGHNQVCFAPGKCQCSSKFMGRKCDTRRSCSTLCYNGGRCEHGRCHCGRHHWGMSCQYARSHKKYQDLNRTER